MAFDPLTLNVGTGGSSLATDTFTDTDTVVKVMPYGAVAFGALNGPYTVVSAAAGLPIMQQTGATFAVSMAAVPVGGATAVKQDTGNTSLASIDTKTPALVGGLVPTGSHTQSGTGTAIASTSGAAGGSSDSLVGLVVHARNDGYDAANGNWKALPLNDGATALQVAVTGGIISVSDGGGSLTVDNNGTFAVQASIAAAQTLATVTTVGTVTTITNAVHVDDNGGSLTVDGSVSVSGLVPGTTATSLGKAEDAVAADGDVGVMMLAVRKDVPATTVGAAGDYHPLEVDANGRLWVSATIDAALPAGGNTIGAVQIAAAQTLATVTTVTSLTQMNGQAISMGTGVRAAGTQRVTIATDDVVPASQSGTWTVQPGNTANTTPWLIAQQATTAGGYLTYAFLSTAAVQAANIKNGAGQVYGLHFFNNSATIAYVRLYNLTTSPITSDTPVYRAMIPANTSAAGFIVNVPAGIVFSTGIGIRVTAAVADNDATALAANVVMGNVLYK